MLPRQRTICAGAPPRRPSTQAPSSDSDSVEAPRSSAAPPAFRPPTPSSPHRDLPSCPPRAAAMSMTAEVRAALPPRAWATVTAAAPPKTMTAGRPRGLAPRVTTKTSVTGLTGATWMAARPSTAAALARLVLAAQPLQHQLSPGALAFRQLLSPLNLLWQFVAGDGGQLRLRRPQLEVVVGPGPQGRRGPQGPLLPRWRIRWD